MFYAEVIYYANQSRRIIKSNNLKKSNFPQLVKHYCRMAESERDASLFRFFEVFLESIPQLLVQGYFTGQNLQNIYLRPNEINFQSSKGECNFNNF